MVFSVSLAACAGQSGSGEPAPTPAAPDPDPSPGGGAATAEAAPPSATAAHCDERIPVYQEGARVAEVCPEEAAASGLTVVDLSDEWTPRVLSKSAYRGHYAALADERRRTEDDEAVDFDKYLELYGIFPTFRVIRERASNPEQFACSDAVNDAALGELERDIRPFGQGPGTWRRRQQAVRYLRHRLEEERAARGLASIEELNEGRSGRILARYKSEQQLLDAVLAVQDHLRCEGLLRRFNRGALDGPTVHAVTDYQRAHMIVSNGTIDRTTRDAMLAGSRELAFRTALRALRERVVDATGLIEDGTAAGEQGQVLGRSLDAPELRATETLGALPDAAPDLISPATEAAARALGWTDPQSTFEALADHPARVAVRLPPPPAWHSEHMDLRAEIDRGDVGRGGNVRGGRRPTNTLFVEHEGRSIPLMRWNTTIGGVQDELIEDGSIVERYKESPVGPRIWRDVVGAPAWLPLPSSPPSELVEQRGEGRFEPNYPLFGPGYRSAYGLAMLMHLREMAPDEEGNPRFFDEGVRSHGSVSYRSILRGHSHGCHRLFNHLALRLAGFVLAHRHHVDHGEERVNYARTFVHEGQEMTIRLRSRGYLYELTPPVPVEVLEGTVQARRRSRRPAPAPAAETLAAADPVSP